jgi:hypothetical protein
VETQIVGSVGNEGIEHAIAGEAEDVVGVIILRPVYGPDPAVVTVAAPHDRGGTASRTRRATARRWRA